MQTFIEALVSTFLRLYSTFIEYLPRIVVAMVVLVIALVSARWFGGWVNRLLLRVRGLPASAVSLLTSLSRAGVLLLGLFVVLQTLNLGQIVVSTIASLGIASLVVGFALQDVIKQFVSGMILLLTRPFDIGDNIKIGVHEGEVVNLQLRVTVLKTAAGDEILIPNGDVYAATLYNMSRYPHRRLAVPFTVPLAENLEHIRNQILADVSVIPGIATNPAPSIVWLNAVDQKIGAELRYWVARETPNQDEVTTRVIAAIRRALKPESESSGTGGS